jgi:hypothetical protein
VPYQIDATFGAGYSEQHPELISAMLIATSLDMCGLAIAAAFERGRAASAAATKHRAQLVTGASGGFRGRRLGDICCCSICAPIAGGRCLSLSARADGRVW